MLLDAAFGTRAKLAILRYLARGPGHAASGHEIARAVRMSPNTIHRAVKELSAAGLVEIVAGPNTHEIRLAERNKMVHAIMELYRSESAWTAEIVTALRRALPRNVAAVLFGSAARGEAATTSDLDLLVIAHTHEEAVSASLAARAAVHRVASIPLHPIHLTPPELRRYRREPWMQAARAEGIPLTKLHLEDFE